MLLFEKKIDTIIISPAFLKKFMCGKGNADKGMMVDAFNAQFEKCYKLKDHNEVDSSALALMCYCYFTRDFSMLQKEQVGIIQMMEEKCDIWRFRSLE